MANKIYGPAFNLNKETATYCAFGKCAHAIEVGEWSYSVAQSEESNLWFCSERHALMYIKRIKPTIEAD